MNPLELAINSCREFLKRDYPTVLTLTPPIGASITVTGLAIVHSQGHDVDFRPIIAQNSHIVISEADLNEQGVNVRNNGHVRMQGWIVEFVQNTVNFKCIIDASEPDTSLHVIKFNISNYVSS